MDNDHRKLLASAAGGALGGLVGSVAMTFAYRLYQSGSEGQHPERDQNTQEEENEDGSDPTVRVANTVVKTVTGRELETKEAQDAGGQVVHYAFGTAVGLLYGLTAALWPGAAAGFGALFGTAVWIGADEAALPALGLSAPPNEYDASHHFYGFAAHLLYGTVTEGIRRSVHNVAA